MATVYENVLYDRVLKGVEALLEAEFGSSAVVYLAKAPKPAGARRSLRLWPLTTEFVARPAGAITNSYPIEIVAALKPGGGGRRNFEDQKRELAARAMRVLNNNSAYASGGAYQWHAGSADSLEESAEGMQFIYTVTVTEVGL
jgi:hypothetical protein